MSQSKLPMSLIKETESTSRFHILETQPFDNVFGPKAQRKKPNISFSDMEQLSASIAVKDESYDATKDRDLVTGEYVAKDENPDIVFRAGHSRRIWSELYKVIDSADVVIQVCETAFE